MEVKDDRIYDDDALEEYCWAWVIGRNLLFLLYFCVASIGLYSFRFPPFADLPCILIFYAFFIIAMFIFVRKYGCANCYYYGKRCSQGWGKLSSLMYKKRLLNKKDKKNTLENFEHGMKLAGITWILAALIPIIVIIYRIMLNFSIPNLTLLILFIVLNLINFIYHKRSCEKCKMRFICPQSGKV